MPLNLPLFRHRNRNTISLGTTGRFPFTSQFTIPTSAIGNHIYCIGISGVGKSKILETLTSQLIAKGHGCGVLDPHSLLIDDLLKHLISTRILDDPAIRERMIYIDPSRTDYVIPFNPLATPDQPYRVATSVIEAFRRTWPESLKEAPHFSNVMLHSLLLLIKTQQTLVDMPRLLVDQDYREILLSQAGDVELTSYFHDRYDAWQRDGAVMRESSLNKCTALSTNPYLKMMLGQRQPLDFAEVMDSGKILLLDLGRSDLETNKLIGSLIVTGLELAMRRRRNRNLFNLTIDEFAGYVANHGSETTFAHVLSEGRKFGFTITAAHQTLSQISDRILGALGNIRTKIIFGIGRYDAEYLAKLIGSVDTEAIKRDPKTDIQHEVFSPLQEQWEVIVQRLRSQPPRHATVATHDNRVVNIRTSTIPPYTATTEDVEHIRRECLARYGIPASKAQKSLDQNVSIPPMAESEIPPAFDIL